MDAPPLPPPAIEQPAPYQVSYGLVTGRAAPGTRRIVVAANGRILASKPLRGRRFSLRVELPAGDVTVRVTNQDAKGRGAARVVRNVYALPAAASPRFRRARNDPLLGDRLRRLVRAERGTTGFYVQSLTTGRGAAWNAKARFPAASTLKLAIAAAVLAKHDGVPSSGSYVGGLLREMIIPSDDAAANAMEVWLAGSTSAGSHVVNGLMRSIGMTDSIMYGGYEVRSLSAAPIPVRVDEAPAFGFGKYTTAADMATLHRAIWLASGQPRAASSQRAGLHRRRRAPPPLAARPRPRHAEARRRDRPAARRARAAQGGLDQRSAPRHRPRVLARRRLRRERDDVELRRRRAVVGSTCRTGRRRRSPALPAPLPLNLSATPDGGTRSLHFSD